MSQEDIYSFIVGCKCKMKWLNDSTFRESSPQASTPFWIETVNSTSDRATPLRAVGGLYKCFAVFSCLLHKKVGKWEVKNEVERERDLALWCVVESYSSCWMTECLTFCFIFHSQFFFSLTLHVQQLSCIGVKCCLQAFCAQNRKKETKPAYRR